MITHYGEYEIVVNGLEGYIRDPYSGRSIYFTATKPENLMYAALVAIRPITNASKDAFDRLGERFTFDYSLPQYWFDQASATIGERIHGWVWAYPKIGLSMGIPMPVTANAWRQFGMLVEIGSHLWQ
jgi:hypothetical protein